MIKTGWQGRYFEDFNVGDIYQHPLGRTVTEADNIWFTLLTMNTAETHFNAEVGRASEFGQSLVVSSFTMAIAGGQSVMDLTWNAFANLGFDKVRFTHPVFAGDTLWSESTVIDTRESRSRPHLGIVTVKTRTFNQRSDEVLSFDRTFLVYKKGMKPEPPLTPVNRRMALDGCEG